MTATEYFRDGHLEEAVTAALAEVKANPADVARRCFLADLLCFAGDLERADRQLEAAGQFDAEQPSDLFLRRQLLRAELARRQVYAQGRVPEFLDGPTEELGLRLQALIALREAKTGESRDLLAQAESWRTPKALRGQCNQQPFDEFNDLDELTASFFEVFTANGKYYWVPFSQVQRLEFREPAEPRDLLWRCARLLQKREHPAKGPLDGVVYFPALYFASHASPASQVKLGYMTDWSGGGEEPCRGLGQRIFQVGTMEIPILELKVVEFESARQEA